MRTYLVGGLVLFAVTLGANISASTAQTCERGTFAGAFSGEVVVPQNWNCEERPKFWFTDQGSQIIPYSWFLSIERAEATEKFSDPANMDRYRYLPQKPTRLNLDGLPIGFSKGNAKNNDDYAAISRDWLGMTCAACHTG